MKPPTRSLRLPVVLTLAAVATPASADEIAQLFPSDPHPDLLFGSRIAQEPGLVVVGCPHDSTVGTQVGSAYVFEEENGSYVLRQKIDSPVPAASTRFGSDVDVDGGTVVVSSSRPFQHAGWVHVFEPSGGQWALTATLVPPGVELDDNYGTELELDGDVLLVSASADDDAGTNAGAVYVYRRVAGAWTLDQKILSPIPTSTGFGGKLALSGDTAIVGRSGDSAEGLVRAYRDTGSSWELEGTLVPDAPAVGDFFAWSLDVDGSTAVVGAPQRHGSDVRTGAAFVFERAGGAWTQSALLTAPGSLPYEEFGTRVAISGDRVLVGAPYTLTEVVGGAGHLFERDGPDWTFAERLVGCGLDSWDEAGSGVSLAMDQAVVGAPHAGNDVGRAWVFDLSGPGSNDCSDLRTWYVDASGPAPGTGSESDPYTSIAYALGRPETEDGDTLLVLPGTYAGGFSTSKRVAVVSRDGPATTTIDVRGSQPVHLASTGSPATAASRRLEGFTVLGPASTGVAVQLDHGWLRRSVVIGPAGGTGLLAHEEGALASHCVVSGFVIGADVSAPFFFSGGLLCWSSIFWGNAQDVVSNYDADVAIFEYSRLQPTDPDVTLTECITGDPRFLDALGGNFHLSADSPCIDTGHPGGAVDPDGSRADMGAFPFDPDYAPEPHVHCVGAPNSAGEGARIAWSGSTSVAANDFTLEVTGSAPQQFGKFYYGPNPVQIPFGDGFRCVAPGGIGIFRLYPVEKSDAQGNYVRPVDFGAPPAGSGPGQILAGSAWSFQYWYRDPQGPGGSNFNLSDALRVAFAP